MREGRLLAEESPSRLLQIFNTNTLEEVFLILSRRQEEGRLDNISSTSAAIDQAHPIANSEMNSGSRTSVVSSSGTFASTDVCTTFMKGITVLNIFSIYRNSPKIFRKLQTL